MAESSFGQRSLPWPTIMLLAAALLGGIFSMQSPLESLRPAVQEPITTLPAGDEFVPARLWQDPFNAAWRYDQSLKSKPGSPASKLDDYDWITGQIDNRLKQTKGSMLVMPIMVSGEPYAEDKERRLRSRYAALSALHVAGYQPEDSTHVGYFLAPIDGTHRVVPYEWFRANAVDTQSPKQRPYYVLVLWLNETDFSSSPLAKLQLLFDRLELTRRRVSVKVIGPGGTTTLKAMLGETGSWDELATQSRTRLNTMMRGIENQVQSTIRERGLKILQRLQPSLQTQRPAPPQQAGPPGKIEFGLYSPWSTASMRFLMPDWQDSPRSRAGRLAYWLNSWRVLDIEKTLWPKGVSAFRRSVHTDDEVIAELIMELRRRGIDPSLDLNRDDHHGDKQAPIVLISEWDTLYGRAMPWTFAAMTRGGGKPLSQNERQSLIDDLISHPNKWPPWIYQFTYMRGIDGMAPGDAPSPTDRNNREQAPWQERVVPEAEQPIGQRQFDYMRRLASSIHRLNKQLTQDGGHHHRIKAIGVLGSDVYDKLLIMRALRPYFPAAVFFTTDLDARLFDPNELKWTRNLIVASSYGLELHESYQQDIPPFRNTYQASMFSSCLMALGRLDYELFLKEKPRVFEIGRSGPYNITPVPQTAGPTLHPPTRSSRQARAARNVGLLFAVLIAAMALAILEANRRAEPLPAALNRKYQWGWLALGVVFGVIFTAYAVMIIRSDADPQGEPWSYTDGISVWPTETLRVIAAFLSVYFLVLGTMGINISNEQLSKEFHLPRHTPPPWKITTVPAYFWAAVKRFWQIAIGLLKINKPQPAPKTVDVSEAWCQYIKDGAMINRSWRILFWVVLFFCVGGVLMGVYGTPFRPYRGELSARADRLALLLSVPAMLALVFFVYNATRLCKRFVYELTQSRTLWPTQARQMLAATATPAPATPAADGSQDADPIADWLDIQFIAKRTTAVGRLIVYPFVALFVMILSRHSYIDHWDWPLSLVIIVSLAFTMVVYCAVSLRHTCEGVRKNIVSNLNTRLLQLRWAQETQAGSQTADHAQQQDKQANLTEHMIREIQAVRQGAFAPITKNPILVAVLFPFGGMGTVYFIEYLSTTFA